ncbi:MAG: anhydro-N-acetylmuramic acid kinase [Hyphomicrobiales bacterium]
MIHKILPNSYYSIGLMSGTSMDGVDASLILSDGIVVQDIISSVSIPYPKTLLEKVRDLTISFTHKEFDRNKFISVSNELSELNLSAVNKIKDIANQMKINPDLIGYHGQTIFHSPKDTVTFQLGNPQYLSDRLKVPVVFDFRMGDILNGGEGAPLTPIYHKAKIAMDEGGPIAIVNIGGISNITYLNGENIEAFDCGPGNCIIDDLSKEYYNIQFDDKGKIASSGKIDHDFVNSILSDEFFNKRPPKSLDRNYFHKYLTYIHGRSNDKVASFSYLTACAIANAIESFEVKPLKIILTGGGSKNRYVIDKIREISGVGVSIMEEFGFNSQYVEAEAFAYLAIRCIRGLPITFPKTTGVYMPMSGGKIYNPS